MKLSLAKGWTQVEPRDTPFDILLSGQGPGQRILKSNTSFTHVRDLGFSGGLNCPLAVDRSSNRVYVSAGDIISYHLDNGNAQTFVIEDNTLVFWMLEHVPDDSTLIMHTSDEDPRQSCIARLNLESRKVTKDTLPAWTFAPLGINYSKKKVLYSTLTGAAVFEIGDSLRTIATIELPFQVKGGSFDTDDHRVVLGGTGLHGWNTQTGEVCRLCHTGSYPAIDGHGDVWFSLRDGALARLNGDASFEVIVELSGVDSFGGASGSFKKKFLFSPDKKFGLANLTGRTRLFGEDLEAAKAFAKSVDQEVTDRETHRFHHFYCILDLTAQEIWCHEGYSHNIAWVASEDVG